MTEEELAAIEAAANAAKPGPWKALPGDEGFGFSRRLPLCDGIDSPTERIVETDSGVYSPDLLTAQFIAAARSDVPALVAEVRRLRAFIGAATNAAELRGQDTAVALMESSKRAAVAEMKERCAKVAQEESAERNACQCGWSIAVAIRTLPEEP